MILKSVLTHDEGLKFGDQIAEGKPLGVIIGAKSPNHEVVDLETELCCSKLTGGPPAVVFCPVSLDLEFSYLA